MSARVRVVLSDLDDTLFDHLHATRSALAAVRACTPSFLSWSIEELEGRHRSLLETLHLEVLAGRVSIEAARIERFRQLLAASARGSESQAAEAAAAYRRAYETSCQPVAGALALARAIRRVRLSLVVVTNNVAAEQRRKLERCGLAPFVDGLVASEETGIAKPHRGIFDAALARMRAGADEAVMLGDAWAADVEGARGAGVRAVWFNRLGAERPDASVDELRSLEPTDEAMRVLGI
jgi:HAD superfamily hydrolase (TIGR01549 family)